jgi:DNA transposition AAA+ family ATPase
MSNTRTRTEHDGLPPSPIRNLSRPGLRPVNVSLAVAATACRAYPAPVRRACLWLANLAANSQRIQLCWRRRGLDDPLGTIGRITEEALAELVGLDPMAIRCALNGDRDADLPRFRVAVESFRKKFESALPPLVKTADTKTIASAFSVASEDHSIVDLRGKWRHGKTEEVERQWLLNLDHVVWLDCPSNSDERTFIAELAARLGISRGSKKTGQLRQQIKMPFGFGLIDTLVIDEAHNLWPANLRDAKPVRAEFVRELRDTLGIGSVLVTTEQFALSLEFAKQNNLRWAPGQFAGRRAQFVLRDTHTDAEIRAIARLHAGEIEDEAAGALVLHARAEEGYLGSMVEAVKIARREHREGRLTCEDIARATKQQQTEQRIVDLAKNAAPLRRGRFKTPLALTGRVA